MDRGFQAVLPKLDDLPAGSTPGDVLKLVATTLISTVGGAAGPLYGTAYLKGAGRGRDRGVARRAAIAAILAAARDGIVTRGKAEPGDKTMIDAWTPAVDAADAAAPSGCRCRGGARRRGRRGARPAPIATEPLVARKGRASYLGERSAGHRDPGAQSTALLLRAAADAAAASAGA